MQREPVPSLTMLLSGVNHRVATAIRLAGLVLISWSVLTSKHAPAGSGRGLVVAICLAASAICWLVWTSHPDSERSGATAELYGLAAAGGALLGASPGGAASAFVFVAVVTVAIRVELVQALPILAVGVLALGGAMLIYGGNAVGLLAYSLGFAATMLAGSNRRQALLRIEQTELLLAQNQRSHEEQLRAARLEESARIAREIHDVLAHTLAGLTIQLEATSSLLEQGADPDSIRARVQRAHGLAREGLEETRRAVGALRGTAPVTPAAGIEALVADYRAGGEASVELTVDGDPRRLSGATGETVLRVVQEALTNVRKHAPGAHVSVTVHAGTDAGDDVTACVDDREAGAVPAHTQNGLANTGGGFGLQGMRERADLLGGTLSAGATGEGWRVELQLPPPKPPATAGEDVR